MLCETEGIVLKKTDVYNNTRLLTLFTKGYGKLSCSTTLPEKGKKKGSMAARPFSYGTYHIFKSRNSCYVNGFDSKKNFFKISEDIDKYACGAYALEFTDKMLQDGEPCIEQFNLLVDYLTMLERREKNYRSLLIGYMIKTLQKSGVAPVISECVQCGCKKSDKWLFLIKSGGIICENCNSSNNHGDTLIYDINFDIINIIKYILQNPLQVMAKLSIKSEPEEYIFDILKKYCSYHLEIDSMKSENLWIVERR